MKSKNLSRLDSLFPSQGNNTTGNHNRKYEGADHGRRTGTFPVNNLSPNKDIGRSATVLRQRTRYLYQNTVYAKRSINAIANGIVGTGIQLSITHPDPSIKAYINKAWTNFAEETWCDFNGRLDFYGLQKLIAKTYKRDGEVLILKRRVPLSESPIGIQYQVLEMEYLADYMQEHQLKDGGYIINGIEYDSRGKVKYYWLYDRHPSEWWSQPQKYPAEDVIHVLDVDYAGQNRGVPAGAPTIITEKDLNEYEDAEVMAKKTQAAFAMARVTLDPDKIDNIDPANYDQDEDLERIEPGSIYKLFPGEQIQSLTPPSSPGNEDFRRSKQRNISSGYEVTYEMMTGDLSNVNFSSGRMGWIEHQRSLDHWQWMTLIPQFCKRAFGWFLAQLPLMPGSPLITIPTGLTLTWTPPKREMLDPVKETHAMQRQMEYQLVSWTEMIKSRGDNPEEVLKQIQTDIAAFKAAGIDPAWLFNRPTTKKPDK